MRYMKINFRCREYELVVTEEDRLQLEHDISEISSHVCTFAQERCVKVLAARSKVKFKKKE